MPTTRKTGIVAIPHLLFGVIYDRYTLLQPYPYTPMRVIQPVKLANTTLTPKQQRQRLRVLIAHYTQWFTARAPAGPAPPLTITLGASAQAALRAAWQRASPPPLDADAQTDPLLRWQRHWVRGHAVVTLADVLHGIMDTMQDDAHLAPRLAQEYVFLEALLAVVPTQIVRHT